MLPSLFTTRLTTFWLGIEPLFTTSSCGSRGPRFSGVTIPYWGWTRLRRVPPALERAENPLNHRRNPGFIVPDLPSVAEIEGERGLLRIDNYRNFASRLESGPHARVHNWVDSDMANLMISPSDPLFWCHHAYVDYIWDKWQCGHTTAGPSDPSQRLNLGSGRFIKVEEVLMVERLGYEYVATTLSFMPDTTARHEGKSLVLKPVSYGVKGGGGEGRGYPPTLQRQRSGSRNSSPESMRMRFACLFGQPDATSETPTDGNANFIGYFDMMIMPKPAHSHHMVEGSGVRVLLDATESLRQFMAANALPNEVPTLTLVFLGNAEEFRFRNVTMVFSA